MEDFKFGKMSMARFVSGFSIGLYNGSAIILGMQARGSP